MSKKATSTFNNGVPIFYGYTPNNKHYRQIENHLTENMKRKKKRSSSFHRRTRRSIMLTVLCYFASLLAVCESTKISDYPASNTNEETAAFESFSSKAGGEGGQPSTGGSSTSPPPPPLPTIDITFRKNRNHYHQQRHNNPNDGSEQSSGGIMIDPEDLITATGQLLTYSRGWPNTTEASVVKVECEERECIPCHFSDDFGAQHPISASSDWVAILYYPTIGRMKESIVIEQIRQAVLWGASAVILLSLNTPSSSPKVIIPDSNQMVHTKPVILITVNITKILKALTGTTKVGVWMKMAGQHMSSQLTLWATCGKAYASNLLHHHTTTAPSWHGTVCMDVTVAQADKLSETCSSVCCIVVTSIVWFLFYLLVRPRGPEEEWAAYETRRAALMIQRKTRLEAALNRLPTFKYSPLISASSYTSQDLCSICLDVFSYGDIQRRLPCGHGFHRDCIDPWLIQEATCPLCKDKSLNC